MSDLEDEDVILEDIRALQAVLTEHKPARLKEYVNPDGRFVPESTGDEPSTSKTLQGLSAVDPLADVEEDSDNEDSDSVGEHYLDDLSDPETALNLNRKIIGLLMTAQKRLQLLLKECQKRQVAIDEKISERTAPCQKRTLLTIVGIPYFKDRQYFPAPKNLDAKLKASRGELQIIDLPCPLRWTLKDRNALYEAIYFNAKALSQEAGRTAKTESEASDVRGPWKQDFRLRGRRIPEELVQNIRELVGPLGSKELDWMKIAATDFNGRHSASECRAMWHVFLHPDINKGKWKKNEDSELKRLAEEYNFQNWDAVAERLGTNRSGYQCFIRFNTNFKNNMLSRNSSWSKAEDQKLTEIINGLRTGNFIPWGEVAKLMGNRRKQQIYMRWNYSLSPNLKKGRFTEEEDKLLLEGVAKFGSNFTKIHVALLPQRTTAQLNDHYRTMMNEKTNEWSYEDDVKLVKMYDKFGNDWAWIAKEFTNKSRVQVRHRHAAIIRYLSRGLSIRTIPRWGSKIEDNNTDDDVLVRGRNRFHELSEGLSNAQPPEERTAKKKPSPIDLELRDYFKGVYPTSAKRGRGRKCYSTEEVQERTQKLKVILNMLNADLDIPDELEDDLHLCDMEKEVLLSLKQYSQNETQRSEAQLKTLEHVRRRMFGPLVPVPDEDFFVPPLPFDGKPAKPRKKKLVGINYSHNGQKYVVEITREFHTSAEIVTLIGGWDEELQFQKLKEILINKTEAEVETTRISLAKDLFTCCTGGNSLIKVDDPNVPSTSGTVGYEMSSRYQHSWSTIEPWSDGVGQNQGKFNPAMCVPPNYVTLLGFRGILLSKHILEADNSTDDEYEDEQCAMTEEGKKALELLEERLVKLFKFPIELSEIPPPILHRVQNNIFDHDECDNYTSKRKASEPSCGPKAKRKNKLNEDAESSEAQ